jgi:catechol 2,3-dioxygenase-like lactoylglutathione lyase family enzyme
MSFTPHAQFAYYVPDPGEAADWYRDKLGFEILGDHRTAEGMLWVTAAPPGASWQIVFGDVTVHDEGELADRFRAELGFAPHYLLVCDDLAGTVASLESKGIEIADRPHDGPMGVMASFKDLYGDVITLIDGGGWQSFRR